MWYHPVETTSLRSPCQKRTVQLCIRAIIRTKLRHFMGALFFVKNTRDFHDSKFENFVYYLQGQVNELLANVKMMEGTQKQNSQQYRIDVEAQDEIKQLLKMEQGGIGQLINIIHTDLQTLNIISEGMKQILQNNQSS